MMQHFYRKLSAAFLLSFLFTVTHAQVQITVPSSGDTTICNGQPITLHATPNGRNAHAIALSVDDDYSGVVPIGFSFNFYGNTYTQCVISSNGFVSFNTANAGGYSNWSITTGVPGNTSCLNSVMGQYSDIYPVDGGVIDYATTGVAPNRKFIASFCQIPLFSCTTLKITFQIILYETSNIAEVHIGKKVTCTSWNSGACIEGVQNSSGSAATVAPGRNYPGTWTATNDARRFTPNTLFTSYTCDTIPYAPVPDSNATVYWYDSATATLLGTGDTITVSPDTPTTYIAKAVSCGDTSTASVQVVIGNGPIIDNITATAQPTLCGNTDGSITIYGLAPSQSDTVTYTFNGAPQPPFIDSAGTDSTITIPNLGAGNYANFNVKVGYCSSPAPQTVTLVNPPVIISNLTYTNPGCALSNGTITVYGLQPNLTYTLYYEVDGAGTTATVVSDGSGDIVLTNLAAGTYANFVASYNICNSDTVLGNLILVQPVAIPITIDTVTAPSTCGVCDGYILIGGLTPNQIDTVHYTKNDTDEAFVGPAGPYGTIAITGLCPGTYDNIFVMQGICATNTAGPVTLVKPPFLPAFNYHIDYGCTHDTVVYTDSSVTTGLVYQRWYFGDGVTDTSTNPTHVFNSQDTFHTTLYINNGYCTDSVTKTINLIHPNIASFTASKDSICQGQTITFANTSVGTPDSIGNGPYYTWNFGDGTTDNTTSPTHTFTNAGSYNVVLTETNFIPCIDTAALLVQVDSISAIYLTTSDSAICAGRAITFTANYSSIGNTGVNWNFGDGNVISGVNPVQHSFDYSGTAPETIGVTVAATYRACPDTNITKYVTILPYPNVNIGPDTALCPNSKPIVLTDTVNINDSANVSWLWSTGDTTGRIIVNAPGVYYTTVTKNGCTNSDSILIRNDCYLSLPNAFTPNGDGENDYFFPRQFLSSSITVFKMDIYNRWGQLIFETTNPDGRGWDGRMSGDMQQEGVYIYIIDATFKNGQSEHHQGNVTLLK